MKRVFILSVLLMCFACRQSQQSEVPEKQKEVMPKQGEIVKLEVRGLPKGFVQRDFTITKDGRTAYTSLQLPNGKRSFILHINMENGVPVLAGFSGKYNDMGPMLAPGDKILFFASDRPLNDSDSQRDYNIWYGELKDGRVGEVFPFDTVVNTEHDEYYPSINNRGDLYFTATYPGRERDDIYVWPRGGNASGKPEMLDFCKGKDLYEFNAWIHPEDSLIVFSSFGRPGERGGGDLYYSRKDSLGRWGEPALLHNNINTSGPDFSPFVKGDTLFFTSKRQNPAWNDKAFTYLAEITEFADSNAIGRQSIYYTRFRRSVDTSSSQP